MSLLIEHVDVLDPTAQRSIRTDQSILIDGSLIAAIEPAGQPLSTYTTPVTHVLSGQDLLAIPGLISAHTHSPENYLRGATECMPLEPWLVWLYGTCGDFTPRDHYLCAAIGAIEMLLGGVTGSLDHLWHGYSGPGNSDGEKSLKSGRVEAR